MTVSLNVQNVLWNTGVTFGVACAAAAVTVLVNKAVHGWFHRGQSIKSGPSVLMSEAAIAAAGGVTYALASRAALLSFPADSSLFKFHSLHLLFGMLFGTNAVIIYSKDNLDGSLIYGSIASLLLLSTNVLGSRNTLYAAGAVGILGGLRV
ncbi:MAG: hypothetical protein JSS10_09360 [Verrucomicrobia bacterium]|nr:hypothetical protein [Verrucomicrobiota bacterium]